MVMAVLARFGRVVVVAGSAALLSMELVHLESLKEEPKEMKSTGVEREQQKKAEEVKAAAGRSKAPRMAPQFDGLNFYETFIGAAQQ